MDNYNQFKKTFTQRLFNLLDDLPEDDSDIFSDEMEEKSNTTVTKEWQEGSIVRREFIEETDNLTEGMSYEEFCDYTLGYKVPKGCCLVRNKERIQSVLSLVNSFAQSVWDIDEEASVDIVQSEYDGTHLAVTVRCSLLCDEAVQQLGKLIPLTCACDMFALTDGRLELNFEFDDMFRVVSKA